MTSTTQSSQQRKLGIIGFCIYVSLCILSSWRLFLHFNIVGRIRNNVLPNTGSSLSVSSPPRSMTLRQRFHLLLWMGTTLEAIACADISGLIPLSNDSIVANKLGYVFLDLIGRSVLEFLAFASVTLLWFRTVFQANTTSNVSSYYSSNAADRSIYGLEFSPNFKTISRMIVASVVVLLVSLAGIVSLIILVGPADDERNGKDLSYFEQHSISFRIQIFVEAISWFIHAIYVIICLVMTADSILQNLSTFAGVTQQFSLRKRVAILAKTLLPMSVCAVCYLERSIWLLARFCATDSSPYHWTSRLNITWWIGFAWAPTYMVVMMTLYSARKRDQHLLHYGGDRRPSFLHDDRDNMIDPLLSSPRTTTSSNPIPPPVEAFLAFRRFNDIIYASPTSTTPRLETSDSMQNGEEAGGTGIETEQQLEGNDMQQQKQLEQKQTPYTQENKADLRQSGEQDHVSGDSGETAVDKFGNDNEL